MSVYSEKVMEHFKNPRNVGVIEDADGIGEVGNPVCGDMMTFYIKVKDDRIDDVKFQTFGCGAAIAVSSMVTEMAMGKTLEEAEKITNKSVAEELGGLPSQKMHCSNLGATALKKAIEDFKDKAAGKKAEVKVKKAVKKKEKECVCPYCSHKIHPELPSCSFCNVKIDFCPHCKKPLRKGKKICPHCKKKI